MDYMWVIVYLIIFVIDCFDYWMNHLNVTFYLVIINYYYQII